MAGRKTGGLGKGLDALIPNKVGGPANETSKKTRYAVKKDKSVSENFKCRAESESAEKAF